MTTEMIELLTVITLFLSLGIILWMLVVFCFLYLLKVVKGWETEDESEENNIREYPQLDRRFNG